MWFLVVLLKMVISTKKSRGKTRFHLWLQLLLIYTVIVSGTAAQKLQCLAKLPKSKPATETELSFCKWKHHCTRHF